MTEGYAVTGFKPGWAKEWRESASIQNQGTQAMNEKLYQDIEVKIINPLAKMPDNSTDGKAGVELRSIERPFVIKPGDQYVIHTGLSIHLRHPNLAGLIIPRTGIGSRHGIVVGNGTSVIDSDFQGEVMVCLHNRSSEPYGINFGDRVAQLLIVPIIGARFKQVDEFTDKVK
ncbi:hypothetical protein [Burkholderia phage BCSR129]|nr:hypothetical protein [Burkholderia phage BCSR129]